MHFDTKLGYEPVWKANSARNGLEVSVSFVSLHEEDRKKLKAYQGTFEVLVRKISVSLGL
jgi:hypothetical protein